LVEVLGNNFPYLTLSISVIQFIVAIMVVLILILSRLAVMVWTRRGLPEIPAESLEDFPVSIVIPTWNEELIIEAKLNDVESQSYPAGLLEVIIIDASSDDSTVQISKDWIRENGPSSTKKYRIIEEESRLGKSYSINRAFHDASSESKILMMSDVDCRLCEGAFERVAMWFNDRNIGAVTGRQVLINHEKSLQVAQEEDYRDFYTKLRIAESCLDSTPIFHGECAAYRREAIANFQLIEDSNADDSQMALAARKSGFRAIYDPELTFFEMAPPDSKSSRIQKVRRAQGLVRHFWRNKSLVVNKSMGGFRKVLALEFSLHILLPLLVALGFLVGFTHLGLLAYDSRLSTEGLVSLPPMELSMIFADAFVAMLLVCGYLRIPIPASNLSLSFFKYMITLFEAQILAALGKSLHRWQQVSAVRLALMDHDLGKDD
jgi:cellulose synthase/poly-beta-1,6-N-acetylglucosamine synthase-like glycosyltransferase